MIDKRGYRPCVRVVIVKDNKILLGKKIIHGKFVGYEFPGGGVESNDTLEQTVIKECLEEVGILVTNVKSLDITLKYDVDYTKPERAKLFRGGVDTFFAAKFVKYNKSIYGADNDLLPNEWCTIEEAINKIQNSTFNEYTETRLAVLNKIKSNLSSVEKPHFNKW